MNEEIAVRIQNVSKTFRLPHEKVSSLKDVFTHPFKVAKASGFENQKALNDISLDIKKGEFFGIVGRNGSGKSTLLKIIAQIYRPTSGSVTVNGRLVPFIELGVGFNPELTGKENVYLNGALMGFSRAEIAEMYDDIVAFAELENFMDQKLKNYSSGMQVRLAFSVATRAKADVLLIDEVLAVGDADFQRKCFNYFRSLKSQNTTIVFVSHDMEAVREFCDRCALIDSNKVIYEGSPEVAAEKYLKLFAQENVEAVVENSDRWGDGAATVKEVKVLKQAGNVEIDYAVHFSEPMDNPIVGFIVKNSSGEVLCGTNNKILQKTLGSFKSGDQLQMKWSVPNIFGDDKFYIDVAITHRDGVTQADWWHSATYFSNTNHQSTPHPVSPPIELSVKKKD